MDLDEVRCGDMDWLEQVHDTDRGWALVNAVMKLWVPKCGEFLDYMKTGYLLKKYSAPWSR